MVFWKKHFNTLGGKSVKYIIISIMLAMILLPTKILIPVAILTIIVFGIIDSSMIKLFKRKTIYILFLIVVIVQPLFLYESSSTPWYVSDSFILGIAMFLRAITIINSITILNKRIDRKHVQLFWQNRGLNEFDNVLVKAEEILPEIKFQIVNSFKGIKSLSKNKRFYSNPSEFLARLIVPFLHKPNSIIPNTKIDED